MAKQDLTYILVMNNMPSILYKYLPTGRSDKFPGQFPSLFNFSFRVTPFDQLNDLYECLPLVVLDSEHLEKFVREESVDCETRRKILERQERLKVSLANSKAISFEDEARNLIDSLSLQSTMSESNGVICATSNPAELLMWSHYADDHTGFVIGFDPASLEFSNDATGTFGRFNQVKYRSKRPETTSADDFDFLFEKSIHWQYEQEWRMVVPLNFLGNTHGEKNIVTRRFGLNGIKEIILGFRASPALRERVKQLQAEKPSLIVRTARPSVTHFAMSLHP